MNELNSGFNNNSQETLIHILELFENLSNPEIVHIKGENNCVVYTIVLCFKSLFHENHAMKHNGYQFHYWRHLSALTLCLNISLYTFLANIEEAERTDESVIGFIIIRFVIT